MKRIPRNKDFGRKIKIVFYPKTESGVQEFKKYIDLNYFEVIPLKSFEPLNTKAFDEVPDLIVCHDNYIVEIEKVKKYMYYMSYSDFLDNPQKICKIMMQKAANNYILKIKKQIEEQINNLSLNEAIGNIVDLYDYKNNYLKSHVIRTTYYALLLGEKLNLKESEKENLKNVSLLHDIGLLAVPSSLDRLGEFSEQEMQIFKYHVDISEKLLNFEIFEKYIKDIKYHHERIDGKGYLKKAGEGLSTIQKIISITDTFDLLTTTNFYTKRMSYKEAIIYLEKYLKVQKRKNETQPFDCEILTKFIEIIKKEKLLYPDINEQLEKYVDNC